MTFNPDLLESDLIRDEGLRLQVYDDATGKPIKPGDTLKGYPTIGVGRNLTGKGITKDEAMYLLRDDIPETEEALDAAFPWWRGLPEPVARGMANMCFALGLAGLSRFAIMLAALERHDFQTAATECLASKWAGQVGPRAERISNLFLEGASHG